MTVGVQRYGTGGAKEGADGEGQHLWHSLRLLLPCRRFQLSILCNAEACDDG